MPHSPGPTGSTPPLPSPTGPTQPDLTKRGSGASDLVLGASGLRQWQFDPPSNVIVGTSTSSGPAVSMFERSGIYYPAEYVRDLERGIIEHRKEVTTLRLALAKV